MKTLFLAIGRPDSLTFELMRLCGIEHPRLHSVRTPGRVFTYQVTVPTPCPLAAVRSLAFHLGRPVLVREAVGRSGWRWGRYAPEAVGTLVMPLRTHPADLTTLPCG